MKKNIKNFSNNSIYFKTNLITNIKPQTLTNFNNFNFKRNFNNNNSNQIFCKNFLIYLILLKYQNNFFQDSSFFIKKYKKKVYTILRSPYRHKLARHQIHLSKYELNHSLKINTNNIFIFNWQKLIKLVFFLKKINKIFESNILSTSNIKILVPLKFNENFYIKNFY